MGTEHVGFEFDDRESTLFGERSPDDEIQDADIISAVEFDKSGNYVAVGDRGGRIVIFEAKDGKDTAERHYSRNQLEQLDYVSLSHPEYQYKTEFQSREPEFDYLKSLEIEEKINKLKWCTSLNGSLFILSTNDKTIKLWKVKGRKVKKAREMDFPCQFVSTENVLLGERSFLNEQDIPSVANGNNLEGEENVANNIFPSHDLHYKIANYEDTAYARCRRVYANAHDFNINSISNNRTQTELCFGFYMMEGIQRNDLRVNLWNLEVTDQSFNIVDMKPSNMEDLTEVITSAEFHPTHCNLLSYSSSRGFIRLVDMRQSALCDFNAMIFRDEQSHGSPSFLTEIVASISDIKFSVDGRHILSRDYMNLKLWDVRMDSSPVATFKIHEHLRPNLCDLYTNDSIFDKFECCVSGDGLHFATGSYRFSCYFMPTCLVI
ncbi:Serine/threonine protein phosphatase 2A 55 kDa regulatory subunit B beta isoform [Hibiscus syriacus]|uniref:Serine/threonine-protein phosphatase 2A 55 kDa regulatory subunit B n=1 Tax=Hibiscus syriacus TaxID=106335 RepID=A0A6A3CFX2_HIBSY|nr:Serine/threonine protein phosphatase 2A 55 kDa regulatory subunit B beta isoform [Hibiscus syriacus]